MNILGLPGRNDATGPWMDRILSNVASNSDRHETQYYQAWQNNTEVDEDYELAKAAGFQPDLIIAKSLGTLLTLIGYHRKVLTASHCVLIGIPVSNLQAEEHEMLSDWQMTGVKTLFIQQTNDVTGSVAALNDIVPNSKKITVREIPGEDHVYGDVDELVTLIQDWIAADPV